MAKIGEFSPDSRVYVCTRCKNPKVILQGEIIPHCEICFQEGKAQQWRPTRQEILIRTKNVREEIQKKKTLSDRISDKITSFCGNMYFVYFHIAFFGFWLIYNLFFANPFDPFPFGLLTLIVSLEAILLATFILISQNRDTQIAEIRAELDYQTDVQAEKRIAEMLLLLRDLANKKSKR